MKVIAIDGPGGSGKSTVARHLADRLGLDYLDTGAMYRAVAFAALQRGIDPDDAPAVAEMVTTIDLEVTRDAVTVDGVDATSEIRGPAVTRAVSAVAANPAVRAELRDRQRAWRVAHGGGVVEGRDIGTVVFPEAVLKIYLTASPDVRAARRFNEIVGDDLDYETVAADLARRDERDKGRDEGPLAAAEDAIVLDTTGLTVDEVVDDIVRRLT